jgi:predicted neuraminidase
MFLIILSLFIQLTELSAIIPYDGIIHRSTDGSSYAFLSSPRTGDHASFIEEMTPSGTLAVAWFTGGEGLPNTSIAVSLLEVGSQQFTAGVIVSERVNYTNQNPVLYWDNETQILHLYHTSEIAQHPGSYSVIWHAYSKDRGNHTLQIFSFEKVIYINFAGATWATPESFYTSPGAFDRGRIIPTFNKGGLIFPCYNSSAIVDNSFILRSSSPTSEWTRININQSEDLIQPTVVRLNNSPQLRAFFRDQTAEWIYYADSNDDGLTWTKPIPTTLPNNAAGIDAYILKSGAVIMTFNNHNDSRRARSPLTVALSYDHGITWPYHRDVQIHDDDGPHIGEYSYPSLLQSSWSGSDDNDIHLVYTYDRLTIKYIRFNEKWVRQGQ